MRRHAFSKRARFFDRIRRPSWSSLVRTSASTSSPSETSSGGVDRLADRQLVGRDDALGLVADVDEDLVLVDPDDLARDDVALLEEDEGRVVVGDHLPVDLDEEAVLLGGGRGNRVGFSHGRDRVAACTLSRHARAAHEARCRAHAPGRRLRRPDLRRELRGARRRARAARRARADRGPLRGRRAPDVGVRGADRVDPRARPRGVGQADLRPARGPHPARHVGVAAAVHVLDVRLPAPVRAARRPERRGVRDREGRTGGPGSPSTRTAATSPRR